MLKKNYSYVRYGILLLGITFRIVLFVISPPNNGYDDHLEVIKAYSSSEGGLNHLSTGKHISRPFIMQ